MSKSNKNLISVFKSGTDYKIITWTDPTVTGLSILKEYDNPGKFIPIKYLNGKNDSVALIKIGYSNKDISIKDFSVPLHVSISQSSKYTLDHPTTFVINSNRNINEESVIKSRHSQQPLDLESDDRFIYYLNSNQIFDSKKNKFVEPGELINWLYNLHLKASNNPKVRLHNFIQRNLMIYIDPLLTLLMKINIIFFGKDLYKKDDFFNHYLKGYDRKNLIDLVNINEKPKVLGTDLPVTSNSATSFIVFIVVIYLLNYYFHFDFLGLIFLLNDAKNNTLFLTALVTVMLLITDRVLPYVILILINICIWLRREFQFSKVRVE